MPLVVRRTRSLSMRPVVVFPDVEAWAVGYLQAALATRPEVYAADVHVSTSVPKPRRDRMVVIRRDGGPRLDVVREAARLAVRVWAMTEKDAAGLTQLVRALLAASPGDGPARRYTEVAGPVSIADESGQPLRFFTAELIIRA